MVELDRGRSHYLLHVLRLKPGRNIQLFNQRDGEWLSVVRNSGRHSVTVEIFSQTCPAVEEPGSILVMTPIRPSRFEWVIEKAVELGVRAIQPILSSRTVVKLEKLDRISSIAIEAAEQCGRMSVPEIHETLPLGAWLAGRDTSCELWFADERRTGRSLLELRQSRSSGRPDLLIGPEGGFTEDERTAIMEAPNVVPVSLGPRILRAETAAIAALAILGVSTD
ncbi:16S rRNA (uracil1498-N3)-methyltransferase [Arboricoccus pini]|uniref:Ribosomal RNA small subunit methyltransferase E n=1 Tax=Arboricoccus pini TaxID=1963835 RepID=A0A212QZS3_9PROT|nr:16S rRNA (uracil1498-N3)-methyltransferase [Arboricoccus pini]